ncbi:MAG TPA: enolase C-terminal domain-like protein [Bryobacteraceae bacterium]|jgi:galactonate dehydratase|nr:enolase C-terminal domain-like protein [Bryobacteraceae bacterium]
MNARRHRLANHIAMQSAAAAPSGSAHEITALEAYPLREPSSGRRYTVVKVRTKSGLTGFGEAPAITADEIGKARQAISGKIATAYATISTGTTLDGAINMALLDITAKAASAPVYRLLGGPTRHKVRALAAITGDSNSDLARSMGEGMKAGYRAFQVPLPATTARNHGQNFDRAVRTRMESLRSAAGENIDFVLDGAGKLTPGDAASVASSLERFHLLWFNEPCPLTNLHTVQKITDESVTPLGFGRNIENPSLFQDMMREGIIDILRPDLHRYGMSKIRQVATLAETYYTAVAPNHEGGPIATAAALHLAAGLPNFFIQHVPLPAAEGDRRMRAEILSQPIEQVQEGFLPLPTGAGLSIEVNEAALNKYKDTSA